MPRDATNSVAKTATASGGLGSQSFHCAYSMPIAQNLDIQTLRSVLTVSVGRACKYILFVLNAYFNNLPSLTDALPEGVIYQKNVRDILSYRAWLIPDILKIVSRLVKPTASANGTLLRSPKITAFSTEIVVWQKIVIPAPLDTNLAQGDTMAPVASKNFVVGILEDLQVSIRNHLLSHELWLHETSLHNDRNEILLHPSITLFCVDIRANWMICGTMTCSKCTEEGGGKLDEVPEECTTASWARKKILDRDKY